MSTFILETDAVTSSASSIQSLASSMDNISSSVKGYDTSCEDGFDFASAVNTISSNIDACSTKMQNTINVMESVVNSHTQLQNSLVFSGDNAGGPTSNDANATPTNNAQPVGGNYAGGYTGGYSGGYSGNYGGGSLGFGSAQLISSKKKKKSKTTNKPYKSALKDLDLQETFDNEEDARQQIVEIAATQLGNKDESDYLSLLGEGQGAQWCSEFVVWCANESGLVDAGAVPLFRDAASGVKWFKEHNQFKGKDYTPKAGDIIFVGNPTVHHTALVAEVKDGVIHTIEGNIKDKVVRKTRSIGDSNIYGYGTPDYSKVVKKDNGTEKPTSV